MGRELHCRHDLCFDRWSVDKLVLSGDFQGPLPPVGARIRGGLARTRPDLMRDIPAHPRETALEAECVGGSAHFHVIVEIDVDVVRTRLSIAELGDALAAG